MDAVVRNVGLMHCNSNLVAWIAEHQTDGGNATRNKDQTNGRRRAKEGNGSFILRFGRSVGLRLLHLKRVN